MKMTGHNQLCISLFNVLFYNHLDQNYLFLKRVVRVVISPHKDCDGCVGRTNLEEKVQNNAVMLMIYYNIYYRSFLNEDKLQGYLRN